MKIVFIANYANNVILRGLGAILSKDKGGGCKLLGYLMLKSWELECLAYNLEQHSLQKNSYMILCFYHICDCVIALLILKRTFMILKKRTYVYINIIHGVGLYLSIYS